MAFSPSLAIFVATVLLVKWLYKRTRSSSISGLPIPPGPPRLPVLGNYFDVPRDRPAQTYLQMGQRLGNSQCRPTFWHVDCRAGSDVICLKTMGTHIVVLNSLAAIDELLEKRSSIYSDRPYSLMLCDLVGLGWSTPMLPYGDEWKLSRKMYQHALGFDKQCQMIEQREARALLSRLLDSPDGFIGHVRLMTGAVMLGIAYGIDVQPKDDPLKHIAEEANRVAAVAANAGVYLVDVLPILKYVPSWMPGAKFKREAEYFRKWADALLRAPYEVVRKRMLEGGLSDCAASWLMDAFLVDGKDKPFTEHVIKGTVATMYMAGSDTTVSTLTTFFLAMVLHPEIQAFAQNELDQVLAGSRLPELHDQPLLPFITAIVKECLRWKPVLPLDFAHRLTEDDMYRGYYLPEGSICLANIWAVLHNEDVYPNPSIFNPQRFMRNGKLDPDVLDPAEAAFGFGRRICPGKFLAQDELWITVASILATLNITKAIDANGVEITPMTDDLPGLLSYPKPFRCTIRPRSETHASLVRETV
ncbi:cytochrome P450 [Obba rivulosa]|uniref:Cytochrome P450 n=1 Tax=Obba rivulosa TaxID=1052685 RepID=A0A8E2ALU7_9APHY|nr:cytochrome P450 [Obba rivulosa]